METIKRKDYQSIIENQYHVVSHQPMDILLSKEANFHKHQTRIICSRNEIEETKYRLISVGKNEPSELFESIPILYKMGSV